MESSGTSVGLEFVISCLVANVLKVIVEHLVAEIVDRGQGKIWSVNIISVIVRIVVVDWGLSFSRIVQFWMLRHWIIGLLHLVIEELLRVSSHFLIARAWWSHLSACINRRWVHLNTNLCIVR